LNNTEAGVKSFNSLLLTSFVQNIEVYPLEILYVKNDTTIYIKMEVKQNVHILAYHYKYNILDAYIVEDATPISLLQSYGDKIIAVDMINDFMIYYEIEIQHLNAIPFIRLDYIAFDTTSEKERYFIIETVDTKISTYEPTENWNPYYLNFNVTRSPLILGINDVIYKLNPLIIHMNANDTLMNTEKFTHLTSNYNMFLSHEMNSYKDSRSIVTITIFIDQDDNILGFEGIPVQDGEHLYQFSIESLIMNKLFSSRFVVDRPVHVISKQ
jgi:hypothetical protein